MSTRNWTYDNEAQLRKTAKRLSVNDISLLLVLEDPDARDKELDGKASEKVRNYTLAPPSYSICALLPNWTDEQIRRSWAVLQSERLVSTRYPESSTMGGTEFRRLPALLTPYGKEIIAYLP